VILYIYLTHFYSLFTVFIIILYNTSAMGKISIF